MNVSDFLAIIIFSLICGGIGFYICFRCFKNKDSKALDKKHKENMSRLEAEKKSLDGERLELEGKLREKAVLLEDLKRECEELERQNEKMSAILTYSNTLSSDDCKRDSDAILEALFIIKRVNKDLYESFEKTFKGKLFC